MNEKFNSLSYEEQIAIKNKLTRFLLERNADQQINDYKKIIIEYKRKLGETDLNSQEYTDDYVYVYDAITLNGELKKEFDADINELLEDFFGIFEGKTDIKNPRLKDELMSLIGKSDITKDDFSVIVNLFQRDANMKRLIIFHDQIPYDERTKMKPIMGREDEYFRQTLGITKEELDNIIMQHPELIGKYAEFGMSFYAREYERDCLSWQTENASERKSSDLEEIILHELYQKEIKKRDEYLGGSKKYEKGDLLNEVNIFLKMLDFFENESKVKITPMKYIQKNINYDYCADKYCKKYIKRFSGKGYQDYAKKECAKSALEKIFLKIVNMKSTGKNPQEISKYVSNVKFDKDLEKELGSNYDFATVNAVLSGMSSFIGSEILPNLTGKYVEFSDKRIDALKEKWKIELRKKHDVPEFLFRAQNADFGTNNGIIAAQPESRKSPQVHIEEGSKKYMQTAFVSTSKIFSISGTYLSAFPSQNAYENKRASVYIINLDKVYELMRKRLEIINDDKMALFGEVGLLKKLLETQMLTEEQKEKVEKRLDVIQKAGKTYIGREKLPTSIRDFSEIDTIGKEERILSGAKTALISSKLTKAGNIRKFPKVARYAPPSREVLFEGIIPTAAITEIDPIMYDTLLLTHPSYQENFLYSFTKKPVDAVKIFSDMMKNNPDDDFGLNEHELYFVQEYYLKNTPINDILSIYSYNKNLIQEDNIISERMYEQTMRTSVIRKLLNNSQFRKEIEAEGIKLPNPLRQNEFSEKMIMPSTGIERHSTVTGHGGTLNDKRNREKTVLVSKVHHKKQTQDVQIQYKPDETENNAVGLNNETVFVSTGISESTTFKHLDVNIMRNDLVGKEVDKKDRSSENDLEVITEESILQFELIQDFKSKYTARNAANQLSATMQTTIMERDTKKDSSPKKGNQKRKGKTKKDDSDEIQM